MHARPTRPLIAVVVAVAGCLLFAACSSNSPTASTTSTTSTTSSPSSTPTTSSTSSGGSGPTTARTSTTVATTIPFSLKYNARMDVTTTGCTQVLGSWKLTGTLKSSFTDNRNFQIVVDYITQPGDTVLDTKIVTVKDVAPGASADWSATGAAGKSNLACVIRNAQAFPA